MACAYRQRQERQARERQGWLINAAEHLRLQGQPPAPAEAQAHGWLMNVAEGVPRQEQPPAPAQAVPT